MAEFTAKERKAWKAHLKREEEYRKDLRISKYGSVYMSKKNWKKWFGEVV